MKPEPETHPESAPEEAAAAESAPAATRLVKAPRRRTPKLDSVLAESVDEARRALEGLAEADQIGDHLGAAADDDRLVTHRFAARLRGYGGWEWFSTLARAPRSRTVTVCEVGLLPGSTAILAPDWVPWSERVNAEEKARLEAIAAGEDPEKALAQLDQQESGGQGPQEQDPGEEPGDAEESPEELPSAGDPA